MLTSSAGPGVNVAPGSSGALWLGVLDTGSRARVAIHRDGTEASASLQTVEAPTLLTAGTPRNYHLVSQTELIKPIKCVH